MSEFELMSKLGEIKSNLDYNIKEIEEEYTEDELGEEVENLADYDKGFYEAMKIIKNIYEKN
jgi:formiminotetrahydrofolate cyclodeaminase